jgi:hypothetical protein
MEITNVDRIRSGRKKDQTLPTRHGVGMTRPPASAAARAAFRGDTATVARLLRDDTVASAFSDGASLAVWAARGGALDTLRWLHEQGGAPVALEYFRYRAPLPLHEAARCGRERCVQWLLASGFANVHAVDAIGATALDVAEACGAHACVRALRTHLGLPLEDDLKGDLHEDHPRSDSDASERPDASEHLRRIAASLQALAESGDAEAMRTAAAALSSVIPGSPS